MTDNVIGLADSPYPTAPRELGVQAPSERSTITETPAGTGADRLLFYADIGSRSLSEQHFSKH